MRFAASRSKPAPIYARGNIKWRPWSSHSNAICKQRFKNRIELRTQTQPLVTKHIGGTIRAWNDRSPTAAQRRYLSSPAAATLHGKTQGFVLRLPPQHKADATSCSHSNAICHHSFKNRIELRTQEQALVAKHIGDHRRNNSRMKRPQPQPPHRRGTFHRRLQPLYTEKRKVSCSRFLPNTKPMQHHAAIHMRSATTASRNA